MASVLYITEFPGPAFYAGYPLPNVGMQPSTDQQITAITNTHKESSAFAASTSLVRIHNDIGGPVSVVFGASPTAVTNTQMRMAAGTTEYFAVPPGQSWKVSVIQST